MVTYPEANPSTAPRTPADEDIRWTMIRDRDKSADGAFVFAVETTGVVCRPGCPARTPRRENVRFFETLADAIAQGYRPCRRCRPDQPPLDHQHRSLVASACRRIETADPAPSLADLAAAAAMSPAHFHRLFKAMTGVTPKQYAKAVRASRLQDALARNPSVTRAMYDAGFGSSGSFYASAVDDLGMRPGSYRDRGAGETITWAIASSSIGLALVAATERGICMIAIGDSADELEATLRERFRRGALVRGDDRFARTIATVIDFIDEPVPDRFPLPLDIRGTAFQHKVWRALRRIPAGSTVTYGDIALAIGEPRAARAVARACASNEVAIAIPCHRVIRGDGAAGGYRWGVDRKRMLLDRERDVARNGD